MNDAHASTALTTARPHDFGAAFVDGAISGLASAVSGKDTDDAGALGHGGNSLGAALRRVLEHFGCTVDEMSLRVAAREAEAEAEAETVIRKVCEQNGLHVREVEFDERERRIFAAPVLAFRGDEAVVLFPGVWRRWTEVGSGGRSPRVPLAPRGFTFYRTLPAEPVRVRELARALFGRECRRDLAYALAWGSIAAALGAVAVNLMSALVEWALPEGDRRGLSLLACGWAVVALTASNLRLSRALLQARIGTRLEVSMEAALVGRALSLPLREFRGLGAGDASDRIRGACQFAKAACSAATDVAVAATSVVAYGCMLATSSSRAALAVVSVVGVRALVGSVLLAGAYAEGKRQAPARGAMSGRLFELLSSIARIKVASAEPRAFYQWARTFAKVRRAGYRGSLFSGALTASEGFFDVVGTIVLYATCCAGGGAKPVTLGELLVAAACLGGLQAAYSDVVRGMTVLLPLVPKVGRVRPILAARAEVQVGAATTSIGGDVSLRNVTFHYADDDVRILDDVSLDIKSGQFVAIVGPSGCGKSTLIKMILGFYAPTSGAVLLDGKDLASLDLRSVRRQIGAVLQGAELLPSTILFNIVGTSKKTIEDAWLAARRACIAEDVERMPMKMFTAISDRAVTISGGQKQRILIARALVREPKLVVFDEATSALDNQTQAGVMRALAQLDCTKVCIAHRLSTIVDADHIVVMDKGRIVQQGTFAALMDQSGLFRRLVESQLATDAQPAR